MSRVRLFLFLSAFMALFSHPAWGALKVDINPDNNRKDVLTVGFENWAVKVGPTASAEFNGIKVTLRKVGSQGTGLAIGWWKGGLDDGVTKANDGAYVKDGN